MQVEVLTDAAPAGTPVHVLIRIGADTPEATERPPVNLVLAIDRSSSMRGPRIAQAIAAATELVRRLDDRDRLTVLPFDGSAQVLFGPAAVTDSAREELTGLLAKLTTGAGTNLGAAIKKGAEALRSVYLRGAVSRLVLLTDGQPSIGTTRPDALAAAVEHQVPRGVTTTCMGVGEGFDDELLAELARRGRGGFYYLASPADIPAAFGRELDGVFAIVAASAEIKIVPHEGVASVEVLHRLPSSPVEDGLVVEVGQVAAGAPRQVLLRLSRAPDANTRHLATLRVTYQTADGRPGTGHIVGVEAPAAPVGPHTREVTSARLGLEVAAAVDLAWARRASGDAPRALAALSEIQSRVLRARRAGRLDDDDADKLLNEIREAHDAVTKSAAEREKLRRSMRERSQITFLGHSVMRRAPEEE